LVLASWHKQEETKKVICTSIFIIVCSEGNGRLDFSIPTEGEHFHNIPESMLVFMEMSHWSTDPKLRYWVRLGKTESNDVGYLTVI